MITPFILLSGYQKGRCGADNHQRHHDLMDALAEFGITIAEVTTVTRGRRRAGIEAKIPEGLGSFDYDNVTALARAYDQETVLYIATTGLTMRDYLKDHYKDLEVIGTWTEVLPWEDTPSWYVRYLDGRRFYPVPFQERPAIAKEVPVSFHEVLDKAA